ncbi:glycosyltransferase [Colwelliaceae bacterium 6441]
MSFINNFWKLTKVFFSDPKYFISILSLDNIKRIYVVLFRSTSQDVDRTVNQIVNIYTEHGKSKVNLTNIENLEHGNGQIPTFNTIDVSIIVPVYNQWEFTKQCLHSIIQNVKSVNYEVILADDGSSDDTIKAKEIFENLIVVRPEKNLGFLLNCNNAARHAKGKYIVLLNNDTVVNPHWLEALFDKMEKDSKIAICGSKLLYPDGTMQEAGGIVWNDASGWNFGRNDDPNKPEYCYVKEVDYISGASIMIRKDFWLEVDGFDERYVPAYYEDADLAFEARSRGYKVVFHPHSTIIHFEGKSHGTDTSGGIKAYQIENQKKFRNKWQDKLTNEHVKNATNIFKARDRTFNKKTILVIDCYVPWYDKDAGSRALFMYLQFLVKHDYNVKFLGDNFYPHQPYTDTLNELGIEVLHGVYYQKNWKNWIKDNSCDIDVVMLNRPHIAEKYIDFIKENTKAKVIYQCVDLHYLRLKRAFEQSESPKHLEESETWYDLEMDIFRKADVGLSYSSVEVDILNSELPANRFEQIPLFLYENKFLNVPIFKERDNLMFIGGFNHPPNLEAINWFVKKVLPIIIKTHPQIVLNIAGSNPPDIIKEMECDNVKLLGFITDVELEELYKTSKLNVVPLLHGAGVKGKVVESMYYQTPIVATTVALEGIESLLGQVYPQDDAETFAEEVCKFLTCEKSWSDQSKMLGECFDKEFVECNVTEKLFNIF